MALDATPTPQPEPGLNASVLQAAVMSVLATIPQEVLEHIAFFAATDNFLGPPDGITALLSIDRRTHAALSVTSNPYLWSRIFAYKFDLPCPASGLLERDRTIGPAEVCEEFKLRCTLLKRVRNRTDSLATSYVLSPTHRDCLRSILWMAFLMMLENGGKNEQQLREYAGFDAWLRDFLFHANGASLAAWSVRVDLWPQNDERSALGLWLFWYMLKPGEWLGFLTFCPGCTPGCANGDDDITDARILAILIHT